MESVDIEACQVQVRKVIQDVLAIELRKYEIIPGKSTPELSFVPEITEVFLNDLYDLVSIESFINDLKWDAFLKTHSTRMRTTPYLFATYFAYAGYIVIKNFTDIFACFVDILSLVHHFTFSCWQEEEQEQKEKEEEEAKKFLKYYVELFCAFFDKELCGMFEKQGSWKSFKEYLKNHASLQQYKERTRENWPRHDILIEFQKQYRESTEPYANNVVLGEIVEDQVEKDHDAVSFAHLVNELLKQVAEKKFVAVLEDFEKTDEQVKELYLKMAGVASGGMASIEDQFISQEVPDKVLENVPSNTIPEKSEDPQTEVKPSDNLNIAVPDSIKSQDQSDQKSSLVTEDYYRIPKVNVEKAKALLKEMKEDIEKMSELIKFVCKENQIEVQKQVADTKL